MQSFGFHAFRSCHYSIQSKPNKADLIHIKYKCVLITLGNDRMKGLTIYLHLVMISFPVSCQTSTKCQHLKIPRAKIKYCADQVVKSICIIIGGYVTFSERKDPKAEKSIYCNSHKQREPLGNW